MNMKKIKILITDNQRLTPVDGGAQVRIYNQIRYLPENFEVTYLGTTAYDLLEQKEKQVKYNINEVVVEIKKPILLFNSFLTRKVHGVHTFDIVISLYERFNKEFKQKIHCLAQESDILIASHPWFFPFIKNYENKILIYDSHNCEYLLKKEVLTKMLLGKVLLAIIKKIEKNACRKSDLIFACSEENKKSYIELFNVPESKIKVLPNSVDTNEIKPVSKQEKVKAKKILGINDSKTILFVGTYYGPNNEGFDFILTKLVAYLKDFIFLIVGNVNLYFYDVYGKKTQIPHNLKMFGKVSHQKYNEILAASDIAINPMFSGSGINIKMLDYMAAGIPIISTKIGARGLRISHNDMVICETHEFIKEISTLDSQRIKIMTNNSLRIIKKYYDSSIICKKFSIEVMRIYKNE